MVSKIYNPNQGEKLMNIVKKLVFSLIPVLGLSLIAMKEVSLHEAARKGDNLTVLRAITSIPKDKLKVEINRQDQRGYTPLGYAVRFNYPEVVKTLLKEQAEIEAKSVGETPLSVAARHGYTEILQLLLKKGADAKETDDTTGKTALHEAATGGHLESVKVLVGKDESLINITDNDKMTPLHYAAKQGKTDVVAYLLEKKADINPKDIDGDTPLILAARWGNGSSKDVVELLIKSGKITDINQANNAGETALHAAARSSRPKLELIKVLLNAKADPTFKDKAGQTPAEATTDEDVRKLLSIKS